MGAGDDTGTDDNDDDDTDADGDGMDEHDNTGHNQKVDIASPSVTPRLPNLEGGLDSIV